MKQSARQSTPETKHIRKVYPMPSGLVWKIGCSCGWEGEESLSVLRAVDLAGIQDGLNRRFIEHLPEDGRRTYVLVDQREGHEGNWVMPEGTPCVIESWFEDGDVYQAQLAKPFEVVLPVGEIRTSDGQVLRLE